jgi:G6PDH family F420-dependent oxidoreductase
MATRASRASDKDGPARIGYALSSEEHTPRDLVRHARLAEEHGFEYALISDHFHPWTGRQGHSPFVWSVIGGIAAETERLTIGTGVTCPTIRIHPAIVAHAAATAAAMLPDRFFLGVGAGENLNEHVLGDRWPAAAERRDMLEEAIGVIRDLWTGEEISHRGPFYRVENARLYTRPETPPPLYVAASGEQAAELAGRVGDGLIATGPDDALVAAFEQARSAARGSRGRTPERAPRYGQLTVCWAASEAEARRTAHEWWPTAALHGELSVELPLPAHYEQATTDVTEEQVAAQIVCGPDTERHLEAIERYRAAGFDHIYLHQVGPDQEGFLRFCEERILPAVS